MEYILTNDGKKAIAAIYADYLRRIDNGEDKKSAKAFIDLEYLQKEVFDNWSSSDMFGSITELKNVLGITMYGAGTFCLNDAAIAYMENLKWNTFLEGIEVAEKIKSILKLLF